MDDATRARLARCLDYYDTGDPYITDVQALWRAYTEAQVRCYRVCGHVYPHDPVSQAQITEGQCQTCEVREQLAAAEAELGEQRKDTEAWYRQAQVLAVENGRLGQRVTRLEALEAAARARYTPRAQSYHEYDKTEYDLREATLALAPPPGET